jgi:plastocyanin
MSKKEERAVKDQGDISDSVRAIVMRRVIIPPNFTNLALQVNYFTPRFKKVSRGENIHWVNQDNGIHHLQFYDLSDDRME